MARIESDPNYTTPTFARATADADIFKKEDVQNLAAAVSTHDHTTGKGLSMPAGSVTSAQMAAGAAAANVGALGGSLAGTLPNAAIGSQVIEDSMIVPGAISAGSLAPGAAAGNVGALGGVLSGTLPSPGLVAGSATASTGYTTSVSGSVTSTTPGAIFGGTVTNTLTTIGGSPILLIANISWHHSAVGGIGYLDIEVDGTWLTLASFTFPSVGGAYTAHGMYVWGEPGIAPPAAGAHTLVLGAHTNTGTLTIDGVPLLSFFATELRR